jgi:hypothetical protein
MFEIRDDLKPMDIWLKALIVRAVGASGCLADDFVSANINPGAKKKAR